MYIDGAFEFHKLESTSTLEKNETHIMDNRSRIAVIRDGDSFPNDIDAEYYVLEDHLGSGMLRLKATAGGTVIDREEYYPFGDSSLRTWTKKRYQYIGKEKDAESGLYYYGARYYAAWTCRFISVDPLAAKYAHLNPYNNAGNKVINQKDIDGLQGENEGQSETGSSSNVNISNEPVNGKRVDLNPTTQTLTFNINLNIKKDENSGTSDQQYANAVDNYKTRVKEFFNQNSTYTDESGTVFNIVVNVHFNVGDKKVENSIDVVIGDRFTSHAKGINFHYVNSAALDFTPVHELLHNFGLADRYHYVQRVNQLGATEDFKRVPALLDWSYDPQYNPANNIMSPSASPEITDQQLGLIAKGANERSYMDPVVFLVNGDTGYERAGAPLAPDKKTGRSSPSILNGRGYYNRAGMVSNPDARVERRRTKKYNKHNWKLPYEI